MNFISTDSCLKKTLDCCQKSTELKKSKYNYELLSRIASVGKEENMELISVNVFEIFKQNPATFISFIVVKNDKVLERVLLNEICFNLNIDDIFKTKKDYYKYFDMIKLKDKKLQKNLRLLYQKIEKINCS